jgi:hypothetical protein
MSWTSASHIQYGTIRMTSHFAPYDTIRMTLHLTSHLAPVHIYLERQYT